MSRISSTTGRTGGLVALFAILLTGCPSTSATDTHKVSGKITYAGKSVPRGSITFAPDTSQGNQGPGTVAEIRDGKYETMADKGVVGGPYVLTVQGYDGVPIPSPEGGMDEQGKPLFPPRDVKVELPKEDATHDIDLKK